MSVFLFFCVMLSGSAFCAAKFQKRADITFPLTCMGFGSLLFLFGLAGFLQAGFFAAFAIAVALWTAAIQTAWKLRNDRERLTREFLRPLFTPGLLVFLVVMSVQYYALRGSLAHAWDDFSHWVDIAKVMTTLDDFGTNPLLLYICPMFVAASYRRGTSHCLSCYTGRAMVWHSSPRASRS